MTAHDQVMSSMRQMAEKFAAVGVKLDMPPASNAMLGTRYIEVGDGKSLAAQINFDPKFGNPMKVFQGGFLCAAFDEVYGPLSYMCCNAPVVTIEMSTSFLRPFTAKDEFLVVRAEVVARSKTLLVMKGEARNPHDKLIATSTSHSIIASNQSLKREPVSNTAGT